MKEVVPSVTQFFMGCGKLNTDFLVSTAAFLRLCEFPLQMPNLSFRLLIEMWILNYFSVGHHDGRLDTEVDANTFASMFHFWNINITANRTIIVTLPALLYCDMVDFNNIFVFECLAESTLDCAHFRQYNGIANNQFLNILVAHSITVTLFALLGLVSRILGFACKEVLVGLVHIHIGVSQSLRVGFLQPFPFFLE